MRRRERSDATSYKLQGDLVIFTGTLFFRQIPYQILTLLSDGGFAAATHRQCPFAKYMFSQVVNGCQAVFCPQEYSGA